jgi:uncharacterized membrane protein (DUF485 family)
MQPIPQGHGRSLRVASVLLALLVLLAVVAFASRTGFGHASHRAPTPGYVNWATSVFLVLFFVMAPVAIYLYVLQARDRLERQQHKSFQVRVMRSLVIILVIAAGFLLRTTLLKHWHPSSGLHDLFFGNHRAAGHRKPGEDSTPYTPTFEWPVLWGTIVLVAGGIAWWLWWRKTRAAAPAFEVEPATLEQDLAGSIGDAIGDLEAEPDPRRAVIAAYARMEGVLARSGMRREPSETATEYLRRVLLTLTSQSEAVRRLTGLFEQAKFSTHTIDASMKNDAIESLRLIRADLLEAPA